MADSSVVFLLSYRMRVCHKPALSNKIKEANAEKDLNLCKGRASKSIVIYQCPPLNSVIITASLT